MSDTPRTTAAFDAWAKRGQTHTGLLRAAVGEIEEELTTATEVAEKQTLQIVRLQKELTLAGARIAAVEELLNRKLPVIAAWRLRAALGAPAPSTLPESPEPASGPAER